MSQCRPSSLPESGTETQRQVHPRYSQGHFLITSPCHDWKCPAVRPELPCLWLALTLTHLRHHSPLGLVLRKVKSQPLQLSCLTANASGHGAQEGPTGLRALSSATRLIFPIHSDKP